MKIIIDLQAAQGISKNRGIGRYSINVTKALIKQAKQHEIHLVLNGNTAESVELIREKFQGILSQKQIHIFETLKNISGHNYQNRGKINAAEKIRESFLNQLKPDFVYIASPFEGWIDDVPFSLGSIKSNYLTAATLFDLIPYIYPKFYIHDSLAPYFIYQKMQFLKQVDLLFTISNSSSQEAEELLLFPKEKIINCSVGLDDKFKPLSTSLNAKEALRKNYGIKRDFIFYVGGLDFRKNVNGLIKAFIQLPTELRNRYQLVIIVSCNQIAIKHHLNYFANLFRFNTDEIILISYTEEETLLALYNLCSLFVFPSLHEGFGLPVIEAMACGAPVICSNTTSLPEAIGCPEALFNPHNPQDISNKIREVLTSPDLQLFLKTHGLKQARKFTWEKTAQKMLSGLESSYTKKRSIAYLTQKKTSLAYVSPLPSEETGIADYSTQLIPELALFYDIVLINPQKDTSDIWLKANFSIKGIDWFKENAPTFDVIIYQLGNSQFHHYMIDLIKWYPGIVVLHDFFLSGLFHWSQHYIEDKKEVLKKEIFISHGYAGLIDYYKLNRDVLIQKYPCNLSIITRSLGIIVHSKHAIQLAETWYGKNILPYFHCIPLSQIQNYSIKDNVIKTSLGFKKNEKIICALGGLHPTRLNHKLIEACASILLNNPNYYLVFIGKRYVGEYDHQLVHLIKKYKLTEQIKLLGFIKKDKLNEYLRIADIAVQLRSQSRGEASASLLHCLSFGIPTICNKHGSNNELPDNILFKINDQFENDELKTAINTLLKDNNLCKTLAKKALQYIKKEHHPVRISQNYYEVIKECQEDNNNYQEKNLFENISKPWQPLNEEAIIPIAKVINANRFSFTPPQVLIDVTQLIKKPEIRQAFPIYDLFIKNLAKTLQNPEFRFDAIYYCPNKNEYFYARNYVAQILNLPEVPLANVSIDIYPSDILIIIDNLDQKTIENKNILRKYKNRNIQIYNAIADCISSNVNDISFFVNSIIYLTYYEKINKIKNNISLKQNIIVINPSDLKTEEKSVTQLKKIIAIDLSISFQETAKMDFNHGPTIHLITKKIKIGKEFFSILGEKKYLDYAGDPFDPTLFAFFEAFCNDQSNALDVGANIGLTAISLSQICKKGRVIAIEPLSKNFKILETNIKNNQLVNNITLLQTAVGNKDAKTYMQTNGNFLASAFISDQLQSIRDTHQEENINIQQLDNLLLNTSLPSVDFIKMDIEGHEIFALEGARKLLNKHKPVVYLEMNHWCLNVFYRISLPEFKEKLASFFPYVFAIEPTESPFFLNFFSPHNFHHIAHEHLIKFKYSNLIAGFNEQQLLQALLSVFKSKMSVKESIAS